jgi:hypothetical protein
VNAVAVDERVAAFELHKIVGAQSPDDFIVAPTDVAHSVGNALARHDVNGAVMLQRGVFYLRPEGDG